MRKLACVACLVVAFTPVLWAQDSSPGWFVETRVTTVSKGGSGNTTTRTHVTRAWTSATCSRTEGRAYLGDSTAYLLILGSPSRSLQVLPRDRVVYTLDSAARRAIASEVTPKLSSELRSQGRRNVTQVTTNEVLAWRREEVPAARCAVPSGYRTVDQLADLRTKQAATAELQRLLRSTNPADRARARALGDSLFKELRGAPPPPRSLREDPNAIVIDGRATKKP